MLHGFTRGMRNALTAALLGMLFGVVQGCASDSTTAPPVPQHDDTNCVWINGQLICH